MWWITKLHVAIVAAFLIKNLLALDLLHPPMLPIGSSREGMNYNLLLQLNLVEQQGLPELWFVPVCLITVWSFDVSSYCFVIWSWFTS